MINRLFAQILTPAHTDAVVGRQVSRDDCGRSLSV